MKILIESGIVTARRVGKWTYYSICESGRRYAVELLRLLTCASTPRANFNIEKRRTDTVIKPFSIVVDTGCELPPEFIEEHGIEVMPISFTLDEEEHKMGSWQEISAKEFYDALRKGGTATTAQTNPDTFVKSFTEYAKQDRDALFIILSSGLSATYQSSQIALAQVKKTYPDCNIFSVDSISATSYITLLTMLAVKKRQEGFSAEETAACLEERMHSILGFFTVDDLMYLHRGGRLSKLSAIGGSLLGIKPILNIQPDGTLKLKGKVRGRKTAFELMVNQLKECSNPDTVLDNIVITHTDSEDDALKLAEMVKDAVNVKQVSLIMMGPVIGTHLGPGAITLSFEAALTRQEYENKS